MSCSKDNDEPEPGVNPNNPSNVNTLTADKLAGTWEIVYSKGYNTINGKTTDQWDEDVSNEHNRFVFKSDGTMAFMEYSNSKKTWHEDGKGTFYFQAKDGKMIVTGDFENFNIISYTENEMVIEYTFSEEKGNDIHKEYHHDTLHRITTNNNGNIEPEQSTNTNTLTADKLVGTWEIVYSKGYNTINGQTTDQWDEDVSNEHNRFVFKSDGTMAFMEYSNSKKTWHEDGKGTFYFQAKDGKMIVTGDFENFNIISYTENEMVIEYTFSEEKGNDIHKEYHHDTLHRIVTDNNGNIEPETNTNSNTLTADKIVGTWEIVYSKGYRSEDGNIVKQWDEDVSNEHNRFIFSSNGTWAFMEYSDSRKTWHEDGTGTFYFQAKDGKMVLTGIENFNLVSYTENEMVIEYMFSEQKSVLVEKHYRDTLYRIITK